MICKRESTQSGCTNKGAKGTHSSTRGLRMQVKTRNEQETRGEYRQSISIIIVIADGGHRYMASVGGDFDKPQSLSVLNLLDTRASICCK